MLDHEFSALIGAPNSIRDEDITVKLPKEVGKSIEDIYLSLHVQLAQLTAQILASMLQSTPSKIVLTSINMKLQLYMQWIKDPKRL